MTHIDVKPSPALDEAAWPLLKHPVSGGLLDASGAVPADGRPWLNDGFTARMLTDGAVVRAELEAAADEPKPEGSASTEKPTEAPAGKPEPDPAR